MKNLKKQIAERNRIISLDWDVKNLILERFKDNERGILKEHYDKIYNHLRGIWGIGNKKRIPFIEKIMNLQDNTKLLYSIIDSVSAMEMSTENDDQWEIDVLVSELKIRMKKAGMIESLV